MTRPLPILTILIFLTAASQLFGDPPDAASSSRPWRGLHVIVFNNDDDLEVLGRQVPKLADMGVNVLVLEVNYSFEFTSHPELRAGAKVITPAGAERLANVCSKHGIRLIPEFQCVGHQSWKEDTFPLLTVYPQFDLTPGAFPENKGIYCREWDPLHPEVNKIVFALLDEILDAFHADALHVGMDEIFLIGSDQSPSTKGKNRAQIFARAVNDLHQHLVKGRRVEMLMWADRLFDADKFHWGEWEASKVGTAGALDLIPKDIVLCPWHYEKMSSYPSIPHFLKQGFRVLPASWKDLDASRAVIEYSQQQGSARMLGHLFTTWGGRKDALADYPPLVEGLKHLHAAEQRAESEICPSN